MKQLILCTLFTGVVIAARPVPAADATATNAPASATVSNAPALPPVQSTSSDNQTPQPADQPPPLVAGTNTVTSAVLTNGGKGLRMNFRNVPLETVLNYMSDAAGYIIHPRPGVDVSGRVTVWSTQPLTKEDAVKFLKQALQENGYAAVEDGRTLTILRADEASKDDYTKVFTGAEPESIPRNPTVVTQIIPVHTLNVVQLVKNLQPLLPSSAIINADESANALVLTDSQSNIHRIVEIIKALDSVTSGNATIQVFTLKFADSKSLAQLIKDLFPDTSTAGQNGGPGGSRFSRFRSMMMGGFGGSPGGGDNGGENGHTPTAKINAVSDDHSNSLIVSAPDGLIDTISNLVFQVDQPVDDATISKIFELKNADPGEMADLLTSLFSDDSNQTDASRQTFGFRPFPFGGFGGSQSRNASSSNNESDRMKKMARVVAVADRRTSSLIVTTSTNMMDQVKGIIESLDKRSDRKMKPFAITLENADPADVLPILQSMFPAPNNTSTALNSQNQQENYLQQRTQTQLQNQNNQNTTSGFGNFGNSRSGF